MHSELASDVALFHPALCFAGQIRVPGERSEISDRTQRKKRVFISKDIIPLDHECLISFANII
ncbi:hypothetical protein PROFUN_02803 [Planoprotostelium fungivorum]|uniref:Uncharacterized protein n=1 Tax=Planoprotostelium fungivorum TaxID=1890364 RepID=A0A2P6NXM2_9EUKA|nr:hypothetical protein PROFUN_02803 [Planoprotostelium fungivorum]